MEPRPETLIHPDEGKKKRPPTALQVAHWITFKEEQRLDWQKAYLTRLCEIDPQIRATYELIQEFTTMLRERQGERLNEWLTRAESQGVAALQGFAQSLQKDYEAVKGCFNINWAIIALHTHCKDNQNTSHASSWAFVHSHVHEKDGEYRISPRQNAHPSPQS